MGFHSKNIIDRAIKIAKKNFKLIVELCYYMSCFTDKQKEDSFEKIKEITSQNNYIIDDTSNKAVWKFIHKEPPLELDN